MSAPAPDTAQVLAAHRRLLTLRDDQGQTRTARLARRDLLVVCGDRVRCEFDSQHGEWHVVGVEPRRSALYRTNARGGGELIAANLTQLLVVLAPLPVPDFFIIDRYLAAAHCSGLRALIVLNKCELPLTQALEQSLAELQAIGYECLRTSAQQHDGVPQLRERLQDQCSMLVGQSGVGKSSLLAALAPESGATIGALLRDDEGRHTTTASQLYLLPGGGELIDSPGVRDFAPALDRLDAAALGFAEIEQLAPGCRFADCRHLREPNCAVQAAVGSSFSARRYESYRRLRRLHERLLAPH